MKKNSFLKISVITVFALILTATISISSFCAISTNNNKSNSNAEQRQHELVNQAKNLGNNYKAVATENMDEMEVIKQTAQQHKNEQQLADNMGKETAEIVNGILNTNYVYHSPTETLSAEDSQILNDGGLLTSENSTTPTKYNYELLKGVVQVLNKNVLTNDQKAIVEYFIGENTITLSDDDPVMVDLYKIYGDNN